jgi:hypothetical protein
MDQLRIPTQSVSEAVPKKPASRRALILRVGLTCVAALSALQQPLRAADAPLPDAISTKQTSFSIPFTLPETSDPNEAPVEVRLYSSVDSGHSWSLTGRVGPKQRSFAFKASHDGEYWFVIRTLDRQNHLKPENGRVPELRVIIDTLPPRLELTARRTAAGDVTAHWVAVDPLLQTNTLKIEYQSVGDSTWRTVTFDPPTGDPNRSTASGDVTWHPPAPAVVVRAEIRDRAGHAGAAQAPVGEGAAPIATSPGNGLHNPASFGDGPMFAPPANSSAPSGTIPNAMPRPDASPSGSERRDLTAGRNSPTLAANTNVDRPAVGASGTTWPADQITNRTVADSATHNTGPSLTAPAARPAGGGMQFPLAAQPLSPRPELPAGPIESHVNPPVTDRVAVAPPSAPGAHSPALPYQSSPAPSDMFTHYLPRGERPYMVNSRRFALEYEIESAAGGVSQVQVWGTRDGGRTWSSFGLEPAGAGPVRVSVESEGLYGFRITVQDSNGVGGKAPQAGDLPELWVGVDLTKPTAQLTGVDLGAGAHAGELAIRWQAADPMLAARPVTLMFSDRPGGPWSTIAAGLDNTGVYIWRYDRRVPDPLFLRVEVRDEAGNIGSFESVNPISLDPSRAQGQIRSVRPEPDSTSSAPIYRYYR